MYIVLIIAFWTLVFFVYFSTIEWAVHKMPMHMKKFEKIPVLGFFFKTHIAHHKDYSSSHYECEEENHHHDDIVLPWWAGILLATSATLPFIVTEIVADFGFKYNLSITCFALAYVYYWLFEWIHVAMHNPMSWERKFFGALGVFNYLQEHHRKHHSSWGCNFNLLCPIADYLYRTKK